MQDENGRLESIVSVEDNLGQLRLLAYTNLSNDDFTMSLDIKQLKEFQFSCWLCLEVVLLYKYKQKERRKTKWMKKNYIAS